MAHGNLMQRDIWHNSLYVFNFNFSTDALTFESVALLIIFAFLSLLPGVYRNRVAIKANLIKFANFTKNGCCCKKKNELPTSEEPTENSSYCHGARTSEEDQHSCQINNDTST